MLSPFEKSKANGALCSLFYGVEIIFLNMGSLRRLCMTNYVFLQEARLQGPIERQQDMEESFYGP